MLEDVHPSARATLEQAGAQVTSAPGSMPADELKNALSGVHLLGIRSGTNLDAGLLESASELIAIGCFCIGTNQVDLDRACGLGIPVFNAPFANSRSVAELTMCEIVALLRGLLPKSMAMHAGVWDKSADGSREVRGKTLGIVGYGHVGSQVSVLAEALSMRVIFHDIVPRLPLGNSRACRSLDELLRESDVVTLHVPATPATRGLIDEARLSMMRRGAMLINNARGSIVDLEALAEAVRDGRIAGAALDVFPQEPGSSGQPFESQVRGLPNVILTPHIGGSTLEAQESIAKEVAGKLASFVLHGSTTGSVNVPEVELPGRPHDRGADEPSHHRLLHFHRNVPGVLSKLHAIVAEVGANISGEYLRTNNEIGYVVLDTDPSAGAALAERIATIEETIRVRVIA
ncbi:MAG: phosphoglycerate dehydrogenase [Planctomycetes bacterium]|nr:phosphoglycerate dehydrogenase [Planctomycetota bacterium]